MSKHNNSYSLRDGCKALWDASIIESLPENKRDGNVLFDDNLKVEYLQVYLTAFFFFGTVFFLWKTFFTAKQHPNYISKGELERYEYLQLWAANCHHVLIVPIALYTMRNSECEGSYPYMYLSDKQCFYTPDSGCVKANLVTLGYLSYDFILYKFFMPPNDLNFQTTMHHVFGVLGLGSGLLLGFGMPCSQNIALLCEISTFFLNYRTMYTKEELNQPTPMVCQILFFITYTLIRIFFFPISGYHILIYLNMTWDKLNTIRKMAAVFNSVNYVLMLGLNLYWYGLILKGLRKLLESNGILKPRPKKVKDVNKKE